jgi:putative transcriptional regulator
VKIRLKELRIRKCLTQEQLAEKSGVSRSYISEIETEAHNPTIDIICKLCKALNCTANDLIYCD